VSFSEEVDGILPHRPRDRRAWLEIALLDPARAFGARRRAEGILASRQEDIVRSQQELGVCTPESMLTGIHHNSRWLRSQVDVL
jgi:hypothetical protein